jgi:mRNA interferase RelE/StbE
MKWHIHYSPQAVRILDRLDRHIARQLTGYLRDRISTLDNPRSLGKALKGSEWGDCWRYRCGDYRIIVDILDREVVIHVMRIGNRKDVY